MKRNIKRALLAVIMIISLLFGIQSCYDSNDVLKSDTGTGALKEQMVMTYLNKYPDKYSLFIEALKKTKMDDLLTTYGKYTLFVPNDSALRSYIKTEKGDTGTINSFTSAELRKLVLMHMIDAESQGNKILYTYDTFVEGELPVNNMYNRTIQISFQPLAITGYVSINKTSYIVEKDSICKNGVVHTINKVLEPVDFLLPEAIMNNADYSIFAQALYATHLSDSISKTTDGVSYTDPVFGLAIEKVFAYTAFVEPDAVYKAYGIDSYEALKAKYDDGVGDGITDPKNGLNRFVAYHLMPVKKILQELFPEPMMTLCPNTLLDFDLQDQSLKYPIDPFYNFATCWKYWKIFAQNISVLNRGTTTPTPNGYIEFDYTKSNNASINGVWHSLKQLLDVTEHGVNGPARLQKRLRFDVWSFIPELTNNRTRLLNLADSYTNDIYYPEGYLTNIKYTANDQIEYNLNYRYVWLYSDMLSMGGSTGGWWDITFELPPIPAGTWEVRFEWGLNTVSTALIQCYFDDEIQGVPFIVQKGCAKQFYVWLSDYVDLLGDEDKIKSNDREMRNTGMMKGANSAISHINNTARYDVSFMRKIVCTKTFNTMERHTLRIKTLSACRNQVDFIEFVPVNLINTEDRW